MSNSVFPTLPGLKFGVIRRPIWGTSIKTSVSGREFRAANMLYPNYLYRLSYEFLRDLRSGVDELRTLVGFFNARQGRFDTFLYSDPDDNAVTAQSFGTGNGTTTAFQLLRTFGGFLEPVYDLNGAPLIYRNDWQGNQLLYSTARTNLLLRSQELDNASWSKTRSSCSGGAINAAVAPDSTTTADKLVEDSTASATHYASQTYTKGSSSEVQFYTASFFAKAAERSRVGLYAQGTSGAANGANVIFNLATGIAGTVSQAGAWDNAQAFIQPLANGWFRCSLTFRINNDGQAGLQVIAMLADASSPTYSGDGTSGAYIWGMQLEKVATSVVATSYIGPTTTAAVTLTDYALSASGLVTLAVAPLSGALLTWTGSYYWRCRFEQDAEDFEKFLQQLWQARQVEFRTVKP